MDEILYGRILIKQSEILAYFAEMEGMKATNEERKSKGESLAYTESDFNRIAIEFREIACGIHPLVYF